MKRPSVADVADSASAAIAIPLIGAGDTPTGSDMSGRLARCGIIASVNLVKLPQAVAPAVAWSLRRVAEGLRWVSTAG